MLIFFFFFFFVATGFDFKYIHFVFCYVWDAFFITKLKILCSTENEFVWDREVQWFFYVQASVCRLKNLISVNLAYNEHLATTLAHG